MFYKFSSPQKDASIKLTLILNCDNLNQQKQEKHEITTNIHKLSSIFEEFCISDDNFQAIGLLMFLMDDIVTIIQAKNSNKFR